MNAKFARFIAGSRYYTPLFGMAYSDGLPSQFGMVTLLPRCIKGIHIYMHNRPLF